MAHILLMVTASDPAGRQNAKNRKIIERRQDRVEARIMEQMSPGHLVLVKKPNFSLIGTSMRCKIRLACLAALPAVIVAAPSYGAATDEVIVHFRDQGQSAQMSQIQAIQEVGAKTIQKTPDHGNIVLLEKAPGESMDDFMQRLRSNPDVLSVEQNQEIQLPDPEPDAVMSAEQAAMMVSVAGVPNDPLLSWGYGDIEADRTSPAAGEAPLVAVIDTGVDYTHPELAGRVVLGHDFHNDDDDPMDDHGHGTHVSGIIAAAANNGQGSAGVAPGSRILALKVLGADGGGSTWNVIQAIYAAADHPDVKIISMSLGTFAGTIIFFKAVEYAAVEKGKLITAAAGNSDTDQSFWPAVWSHHIPGVIGVAANDETRCKAWFSNYGDNATISAPGLGIWSSLPGNRYAQWSGTSMATPFVSGAAARLLADNPGLTNLELKSLLERNGDNMTLDGDCWPGGTYFQHLNLNTALAAVPAPQPDDLPPQVTIQSPTANGDYETAQASIEVTGIAADNRQVSRITWNSDRGGSGTADGTTAWTIPDLALQMGENTITVSAFDPAGNRADTTLHASLVPAGTETILLRVDQSSDDGFEVLKKGKTVVTKRKAKIVKGIMLGYHFDGVDIPRGASIVSATLSQYGFASQAEMTFTYNGEAAGDAGLFINRQRYDLSQREPTLETVTEHAEPWTETGYHPSPDLGAIVQELVSLPDWNSGNAINIFVSGQGGRKPRVVNQFDWNPSNAAMLEIRYRVGN